MAPIEPDPTPWRFPPLTTADDSGLVGIGADLEPGTILSAYRTGLFPMPVGGNGRGPMGWWSPDPRALIPLDGLRVSRSLRRSCQRFDVRVDTAFAEVIDACADRRREHGWIDRRIKQAYTRLHHMGWVHSVEAWSPEGELAGGLYGVGIGGFFAGESMFHRSTDASKVALVGLVALLAAHGARLLDVQWLTPHLESLGAVLVSRERYVDLLGDATNGPAGPWRCTASTGDLEHETSGEGQ